MSIRFLREMKTAMAVWVVGLGLILLLVATLAVQQSSSVAPTVGDPAVGRVITVPRGFLESRDGRLHWPGAAEPFSGQVTDYYDSGRLKLLTAVREGRPHGESNGWYSDGAIELREEFLEGVSHGLRMTWHPNGQRRSEGWLIDGLQEGLYRQWHENGQLAAEAEFSKGKPHGRSLAWYPSGWLKAEAVMERGEIQERQFFEDRVRREPKLSSHATEPAPHLAAKGSP